MATRKAGRASKKKSAARRRGVSKARKASKKKATAKKRATPRARKPIRRAKVRTAKRKVASRATKRSVRRPKAAKRAVASTLRRRVVAKKTRPRVAAKTTRSAPATSTASPARRVALPKRPVRTAPGLNRERRRISDDDLLPSPPSSLDLDRSASAARSGRRELRERYDEHTETGPAMTGGDIDADWESAYSVGDEAPGGDNPTPDQDIVDDIGRAVGVQYNDNEELKGEKKISDRDRHRWELDPASSDDWEDR
jgi:hypothetical protein